MARVHNRLRAVGAAMQQFGASMTIAATALGIPLVMAARQAAGFEDAILGLSAAAGLSADEVRSLEEEALRLSKAMGVSPTKIANAMLELAKAGMSVADILNGAAEAAIQFARVSGVEMADAAVFMKVAMNSFGVSAVEAVDTLSAAADASETSIAAMVESFALVGSAGALFNQSLFDISQGLAVLARFGIKGEEAGTGIKTLLVRLTSPSKEAEDALAKVGLALESFRDADGKLLPLVQIVGILEQALRGVDQVMRDRILGQVFGDRGIRVIGAFLTVGTAGFETMADAMESNLPVAAKFQILMSGLSGAFEKLGAAVTRLSISFAKSLGDSAGTVVNALVKVIDVVGELIRQFPEVAKIVVGVIAGLFALGAAAIVLGLAFKVLAAGIGVLAFAFTPIGAAVLAGAAALKILLAKLYELSPAFKDEADRIMAAAARMDFSTAWRLMNINLAIYLVEMAQQFDKAFSNVKNAVMGTSDFIGDMLIEGVDRFLGLFGSDVLYLQGQLEKLGLYFRSAFDFSWATGELDRALAAVDERIERERGAAPTANARASQRADRRRQRDDERQAADDARRESYDPTLEELRREREGIRRDADEREEAFQRETTAAKRTPEREPGAAGAAGAGFGAMLATFASDVAGQIGIGPEIDPLTQAAQKTADNTNRAANALDKLIGTGDFGKGGMPDINDVQRAVAAIGAATNDGAAPPVADGDRNLVSAAEQTAGYAGQTVELLRRLVSQSGGGMAFA